MDQLVCSKDSVEDTYAGKYVQPRRGPLGRAYEWLRKRVSGDTGAPHKGKFAQEPQQGVLGKVVGWYAEIFTNTSDRSDE